MDQSLSAAAGTGNLLNIGTATTSTAGAGAAVTQTSEQGFGFTMLQAQQQDRPEGRAQGGDAGQELPASGQVLPQSGVPEAAEPESKPVTATTEGGEAEPRLQPDLVSEFRPAGQAGAEADQVLQQIDRYQKADLSVAVDSALQQYSGKSPVADMPKGVDASGFSTAAVQGDAGLPDSAGSQRGGNAGLVLAQLDSAREAARPGELISAVAGQHGLGRQHKSLPEPDKAVPEGAPQQAKADTATNVMGQHVPAQAQTVSLPDADPQTVTPRQPLPGVELPQSQRTVAGLSEVVREQGSGTSEQQRSAVQVSEPGVINVPTDSAVDPVRLAADATQSSMASDVAGRQLFGDSAPQLRAEPVKDEVSSSVVLNRQGEVPVPVTGEILQPRIDERVKDTRKVLADPVSVPQSPVRANDNGGAQVTQLRSAAVSVNSPQPENNPPLATAVTKDSINVQAKPDPADLANSSRLQASPADTGSRSELRQDSFLTSFADSLAAAKTIRQQSEPVPMAMPQGVKPGMPVWNQAINERIMMLSTQNGRFAEIQLDPPELGSLQVKLQVKNDQVSVVFNTPHASVREALEQGLPRLREMFEEQGLSLGDASVDDQAEQQARDDEAESPGYGQAGSTDASADAVEGSQVMQQDSLGLVDYYA